MELSEIRQQAAQAALQVCEGAKLKAGDLFVVGCSSSEVCGETIGTHSSVALPIRSRLSRSSSRRLRAWISAAR